MKMTKQDIRLAFDVFTDMLWTGEISEAFFKSEAPKFGITDHQIASALDDLRARDGVS